MTIADQQSVIIPKLMRLFGPSIMIGPYCVADGTIRPERIFGAYSQENMKIVEGSVRRWGYVRDETET